jgi:iron(III) transport system ATP-binding protein
MNRPAIASNWLLEVSNLRCGYGGEAVVKNASVALRRGDIGCLLGLVISPPDSGPRGTR